MLKENSMNWCINKRLCGRDTFSEFKVLGLGNLERWIACSVCDSELDRYVSFILFNITKSFPHLILAYSSWNICSDKQKQILGFTPHLVEYECWYPDIREPIFQAYFVKRISSWITHPSPSIYISWVWGKKEIG